MREIKYRALGAATNEWVYGYYVVLDSGFEMVECIWELGAERATPIDRSTLGQFTGLTDNKGDEVYEGDIVEYYDYTSKEFEVSPVYWSAPMFLVDSGLLFFRSKGKGKLFDGKIIGNIYQHKIY